MTRTPPLNQAELAALLARVEKAEGADTVLDWDIEQAVGPWRNLGGFWREHKTTGERDKWPAGHRSPACTASLDAAVALVEKMLPGCEWYAWNEARDQNDIKRGPGATLWHDSLATVDDGLWSSGDVHHGKTPALALLAALLRALQARSEAEGTPVSGRGAGSEQEQNPSTEGGERE